MGVRNLFLLSWAFCFEIRWTTKALLVAVLVEEGEVRMVLGLLHVAIEIRPAQGHSS